MDLSIASILMLDGLSNGAIYALLALATATAAAQDADPSDPFLRYTDVCGAKIVFSFAGDLWLQDGAAAQARQLTSSAGPENFAKFSPDCTQIAFTARIDGDDQVYVMPAEGGEARRDPQRARRRDLSQELR